MAGRSQHASGTGPPPRVRALEPLQLRLLGSRYCGAAPYRALTPSHPAARPLVERARCARDRAPAAPGPGVRILLVARPPSEALSAASAPAGAADSRQAAQRMDRLAPGG